MTSDLFTTIFRAKQVNSWKNTKVNKQMLVIFWLNCRKYGAVSYSFCCTIATRMNSVHDWEFKTLLSDKKKKYAKSNKSKLVKCVNSIYCTTFFLNIFRFVYNIPKLQTIASLYPNKSCQRDDKFKQLYTILIWKLQNHVKVL